MTTPRELYETGRMMGDMNARLRVVEKDLAAIHRLLDEGRTWVKRLALLAGLWSWAAVTNGRPEDVADLVMSMLRAVLRV